jgi:hypothetical protein
MGECSQSWVPKAVHVATNSNFTPGFDIVAFLEDADGVLKELRITLGVAGKPNTPGGVQQIRGQLTKRKKSYATGEKRSAKP